MKTICAAIFLVFAAHLIAETPSCLTLVIHHLYDGKPLDFNQPKLATVSGETISISRLAYLLSEPAVKSADNGEWLANREWFAFTDASKGDAIHEVRGLPQRSLEGLKFCIGPDAATDKGDPSIYPPRHALNPTVNGLHWGWTGGFVYLAIEGNADALGYSYHLAGAANRMTVTLPAMLDLTRDTTVEIDFQVDSLFQNVSPREQTSTHSRDGDTLAARLKTQVESAFTIRAIRPTEKNATLPAAAGSTAPLVGTPYRFQVVKGFPLPDLPVDFPLTNERVELGLALFHDPRLSRDERQSCSTCHQQKFAFTDPRRFSIGVDEKAGTRNAMPLFNLAWKKAFFWDGRAPSLRVQALEPIQNPVEMHASLVGVVEKLARDKTIAAAFTNTFGSCEITPERIGIAIEAFVLTLTSYDSKFDRSLRGEATLDDVEKRGFELFATEYDPRQRQFGADCFHCHGGALFTDHAFRNNGLANEAGHFATPSLRNVALTAPYMHDGRFATLEEVVAHYDHGLTRTSALDPNLGKHPGTGLGLSAADQQALVAFLKTLTDPQYAP